jgi:hypothetical protein
MRAPGGGCLRVYRSIFRSSRGGQVSVCRETLGSNTLWPGRQRSAPLRSRRPWERRSRGRRTSLARGRVAIRFEARSPADSGARVGRHERCGRGRKAGSAATGRRAVRARAPRVSRCHSSSVRSAGGTMMSKLPSIPRTVALNELHAPSKPQAVALHACKRRASGERRRRRRGLGSARARESAIAPVPCRGP